MNRILAILAALLLLLLVPGMSGSVGISIRIETSGLGQVAVAKGDQTPTFSDEAPLEYARLSLLKPEVYTLAAKADEGWQFSQWTKDGEYYASEAQITLELSESAEYVAVFGLSSGVQGSGDVDVSAVTQMGEIMPLPYIEEGMTEDHYIYVFELKGVIYRAVADLSEGEADAIWSLDWEDPEYQTKYNEKVSQLKISRIENLTAAIPTQDELDQLIGTTGEELLEAGWFTWGYNLEEKVFYMCQGPFCYKVAFNEDFDFAAAYEDDEQLKPFTVKSVVYDSLGNTTNLD